MHPEPLVRGGADHGGEAVVERLGHGLGVAVGDRRLDPHLELEPVGQAQSVDRHQQRIMLERHLRRRQRGGRGLAQEIQDRALGHVLVQHHRRLSARPSVRRNAAMPWRERA
jgi:hypothetical protein